MRNAWLGIVAGVAILLACGGGGEPSNPSPSFRVGGMTSGLDGSLTLQLNSGERLTQTQSGPFLFETPVEDENPYRVAIVAAPQEQVCTLKDASGRIAGGDVDTVQATCVPRTYALGGKVEGSGGIISLHLGSETLSVAIPSTFTFQTRLPRGGTYDVTVDNVPRGYRCSITGGSGTVAGNITDIAILCTPWFTLTSFQAASLVIGQSDFTHHEPNQADATGYNSLNNPRGHPVFAGGKLYIPDSDANRIVGFDGMPTQNNPSAEFFLGQIDFFTHSESAGPRGLSHASNISVDDTRMAVADPGNCRVELYRTLPKETFSAASVIVGQPDYLNISPRCDDRSLDAPRGVALRQGKLVVADTGNNRVLIWNFVPEATGTVASLALGKSSPKDCGPDSYNGPYALSRPEGVWTDGTRLLVADTGHNRVLVWNTFPLVNNQPPDLVLGQPNFTSTTAATTATGMNEPNNIQATGQQLFITETLNNRVLIWNQLPTTNAPPADIVLGQPDFTTLNMWTYYEQDDSEAHTSTAQTFFKPSGVLLVPPRLLVTDTGNSRVLVFESN
jgi:NHL repeat